MADEDLGRLVAILQQKVETLERASQAQHSTVETAAGTLGLGDAAATAVDTAAALPTVEESAATAQGTADSIAVMTDGWDDELDSHLEDMAADLDEARAQQDDAQADIEDAFGATVDGLSEDVTTAITAAGAAGQVADEAKQAALDAAGLAAGKGEVIVQVTAPSGSRANPANLWIDSTLDANGKPKNTPNRYNPDTGKWEPITEQKVIDAAAAALAAQATADGKPLILFSTAAPSGTAPTGSIWFMWDSSKLVAGQWLQSGTLAAPVWTPQQIRSEVIANLDVGKLTAGSAAIAELVAQKIAASTANFQTVNVSNLFVTTGATLAQAVIDFLFVNVVQAKKITAGMIDVDSLSGTTLTGVVYRSAATGARIEIQNTSMNVYDTTGKIVGSITAVPGQLRIGSDVTSALFVGPSNTGTPYGPVGVVIPDCQIGVAFVRDRLFDSDGNQWWTYQPSAKPKLDVGSITATNFTLPDGTSISADTGWVTTGFTYQSGVTVNGAQIRRVGNVVSVLLDQIYIDSIAIPTSGDVGNRVVIKVPPGFAPTVLQGLGPAAGGAMASYYINSAGNITLAATVPDSTQSGTVTKTNWGTSAAGTYLVG